MPTLLSKKYALIAIILVAILIPLLSTNEYYLHILTLSFIWIIAVYGLNLLAGFTGYLSLAHAGFFGIGAYALGLLTVKGGMSFWPAFFLAPVITTVIGFFIGLVALRTKEHFFAIYTLCVGYIIYLVIDKWEGLTGGVRGLIGIPGPTNIGPIELTSANARYYFVLTVLLLVVFLIYRIVNSLVGRSFIAIRNDEQLAQSIGISTLKNKLMSFVLSTFFAGLAGALYASFIRFIGPDISNINITFDLLIFMIVGGIGTLSGPVIGTLLIVVLSQQLQFLQDHRMLIFGPLLTSIIIFSPRGLAGMYLTWYYKRKAKKKAQIQTDNASIGGDS
ncbi:branched-chain amino acid transport system permease protein [Salirhabdus euzebyi]|uniref:Branched-chain amino acid transport system permease protein n=1 Tax=Salirhabdus euzebyi TaxID=394506 RepID=A0A841PWY0_9BACI|nr:branched-chain amino acid ABC transporter permease [Salirhabdus euzebyi]MBB6452454.1 branched-chain amino acid transport system permease protein [Salirhabdus euzebyi]